MSTLRILPLMLQQRARFAQARSSCLRCKDNRGSAAALCRHHALLRTLKLRAWVGSDSRLASRLGLHVCSVIGAEQRLSGDGGFAESGGVRAPTAGRLSGGRTVELSNKTELPSGEVRFFSLFRPATDTADAYENGCVTQPGDPTPSITYHPSHILHTIQFLHTPCTF